MSATRVLTALALGAAVLVQPAASASAPGPPGSGVGTDVVVDGQTIVVKVPVVVLVRTNLTDASIRQDLADRLAEAADYWNRGLAESPFFDCLTIRIEIESTIVHPVDRDYDAPGHVIKTYGSGDVGMMADGRSLPSVLDAAGPSDPTLDYAGPFERRVDGYWPPWLFQDTESLAHEMGHLFGLGDDYSRDEHGDVAPLPRREGTLMDSGTSIDSILVERIGGNVIEAGYADSLPQCERWTGTMQLAFDGNVATQPDVPCRGVTDLTFEIAVGAHGAITGNGAIAGAPYVCTVDGIEGAGPDPSGTFTLTGTRTGDALDLQVHPDAGTGCCAAWPGDQFGAVRVPIVEESYAAVAVAGTTSFGLLWVGTLGLTAELTCETCGLTL
jgi:hypothetical protein